MERTKAIFETVFSLPSASSSITSQSPLHFSQTCIYDKEDARSSCLRLSFESVECGLPENILQARKKREADSLKSFYKTSKVQAKFESLPDLHQWLFTEHNAYASRRHISIKTEVIDEAVLKTY